MTRTRILLLGLLLIGCILSPFIIGKALLRLSISSLKSSSQLEVTYTSAYANAFTGTVELRGVSITRPIPDFVDVTIPTVNIDLDTRKAVFGTTLFSTLELEGLEGRVISQNVSVPFEFSSVILKNFSPDHLVEGALFNSEVSGRVWSSSISITSQNITLSSLPIAEINALFDTPLTGFRSGLLSLSTLSRWAVKDTHYSTQLRIRLSGHKAEVPDNLSQLERLIASQLVAYVNRQKSLTFDAPITLDRSQLKGNAQHDFKIVFETIGTSMIEALPSQLSTVKGRDNISANPLNLSDKHIQSIQKKLQLFLND